MQMSGLHLRRLVTDHKDVIANLRPLFVVDYHGGRNGRLFYSSHPSNLSLLH
jgi:hypothetical protein